MCFGFFNLKDFIHDLCGLFYSNRTMCEKNALAKVSSSYFHENDKNSVYYKIHKKYLIPIKISMKCIAF